jgi:peptide/nickel transport system ATP-binding protein
MSLFSKSRKRGISSPATFTSEITMESPPNSSKSVEIQEPYADPNVKNRSRKGRSRKGGHRYARFKTDDNRIVEGLVSDQALFSKNGVHNWEFNKCYFIKDIGRVGRLWVTRDVGHDDDAKHGLQTFEHVEEVDDDPKIPQVPVLSVENLRKWYPLKRGFFETIFSKSEMNVKAVDDVSFNLSKGEIFALAGESGSGKTTLGKVVLRLVSPTSGHIFFLGRDITEFVDREMKPLRREMQIVFQDPFESLDPRMIIKEIIAEPLRVQGTMEADKSGKTRTRKMGEQEVEERVKKMLSEVELVPPEEFLYRFPHEMSGGQRQRVAVARAFVLNPSFIVADEPVSMLDVSIRAEIVNLMVDLVKKSQASIVFISHDIALAKHIADRIGVLYLGKMMELGSAQNVVDQPLHPYTQALVSAVPVPDPESKRTKDVISGEIPSPVDPPSGCRFHTRCPYAHERCVNEEPPLVEVENGHYVACHLYS